MHKIIRFFKTPKGLLTIILLCLTAIAAPGEGAEAVAVNMGSAAVIAGVVDLCILRLRRDSWQFPSGAVLTAMIVTMVVRAQDHWYVPATMSVVAVISKYLIRTRTANVFNPAAFALVAVMFVLPTAQSWWGALPQVSPVWVRAILLLGGIYIADRVNKMPLALSFLGAYFAIFTATAYLGDPRHAAEIFRSPDLEAVLYFALIILTDPPTSPARYKDQWICGVMVAAVSYAVFEIFGVVYFLLAGALAGNLWAAWRRVHRKSRSNFPRNLAVFMRELNPVRGAVKRA
ncbi:MAG TPA: RnfABCDGE type electron transport complex subunit D [Steroidobacteraceae bacterium]|nr:RnfABCDGE type electron transport complex subunit D [Steroidobacteraceae bacterium]